MSVRTVCSPSKALGGGTQRWVGGLVVWVVFEAFIEVDEEGTRAAADSTIRS